MRLVLRIASAQLMLAMIALIVMGSVTVTDVILKYLFGRPIAGAYDVVESLLPVVIFNGLPATLLRRQNIAIDLIDHFVGPERTRILVICGDLTMAIVLVGIASAMLAPALQAFDYGDRKLELGLPLIVVWGGALLGMIGSVLAAAVVALNPPAKTGQA